MNARCISDQIESFIRTVFDVSTTDSNFNCKVDLFEAGYVDSTGFAELI